MKYQPDHNVANSFQLWFIDHLMRDGEAFTNKTKNLVKSSEPHIQAPNSVVYEAWVTPQDQWVYDSSITGAVIPNGATVNGTFSTAVKVNCDEGKILVPISMHANSVVASYSANDFEIRQTSEREENILFGDNPGLRFGDTGDGTVPDRIGFPYVYLKYNPGQGNAIAFGGLHLTKMTMRAIVVTDNAYLFDGINILSRDASEQYFAIINPQDFPFNELGELKNGSFHYRDVASAVFQTDASRLYYIKSVNISPFSEEVNARIAKNALGGFIDFHIESLGYPHARFV